MANIPRLVGAPDFGKLVAPEESLGKRLEGKRVLLTGTTKGVGRVTQELLCAQGAFVCGSGRSKGVAAEVANELVAKGYKAAGFDVDLSDYEAVKKWVADCAELMGGIDIVINNASHPGMAPFGEMTPDIWAYGIQNELDLVYNVCNCAWPYLIEAGGGSIIITSSTVGLQGSNSPQACHAAAKGACLALARQLAAEGWPFRHPLQFHHPRSGVTRGHVQHPQGDGPGPHCSPDHPAGYRSARYRLRLSVPGL